jgi:hypothetical protein
MTSNSNLPDNNPVRVLYCAWCEHIAKRNASFGNDARILADIKRARTAAREIGASDNDIWLLMLGLHVGTTEFTDYKPWGEWAKTRGGYVGVPVSFWHLTKLSPVGRNDINLLQAAFEITEPPSVQDAANYADWVRFYGARAIKAGKWDGVFRYQPFVAVERQAMPLGELGTIIGTELAQRALDELRALEARLNPNANIKS